MSPVYRMKPNISSGGLDTVMSIIVGENGNEQDWISLLLQAKSIGISVEEIRMFLQSYRELEESNPEWS